MKITLDLNIRGFCIAQFAIVTIVIALGFFAYAFTKFTGHQSVFGFLRLLDVGNEQSIPTYVSVVNLLLASILLFIIYHHEKSNSQSRSGSWAFMSIFFLFLSVDESASIHENFAHIHLYLVNEDIISSTLETHRWLPFGVIFVLVVLIVLSPFLCSLAADTRRHFLIAGCVFVTGAVGFEYLGALMLETGVVDSKNDTAYLIRRLFEEGFEMYGVAIFNCALYHEILRKKITLVIGS